MAKKLFEKDWNAFLDSITPADQEYTWNGFMDYLRNDANVDQNWVRSMSVLPENQQAAIINGDITSPYTQSLWNNYKNSTFDGSTMLDEASVVADMPNVSQFKLQGTVPFEAPSFGNANAQKQRKPFNWGTRQQWQAGLTGLATAAKGLEGAFGNDYNGNPWKDVFGGRYQGAGYPKAFGGNLFAGTNPAQSGDLKVQGNGLSGALGVTQAAIGSLQNFGQMSQVKDTNTLQSTIQSTGLRGSTASSNAGLLADSSNMGLMGHTNWKSLMPKGNGTMNAVSAGLSGAAAGMAAGPWGALAGGILGIGSSIFGRAAAKNKARRMANRINGLVDIGNQRMQNDLISRAGTVDAINDRNLLMSYNAFGGPLFAFGGNLFANGGGMNGITTVDEGGTHESNPQGGVPMGTDNNGVPNKVEEGEVILDGRYVLSNRSKASKDCCERLGVKYNKKNPLTHAELFKKATKEAEKRPNDEASKNYLDYVKNTVYSDQEQQKQMRQQAEAEAAYAMMSPEEKQALQQQIMQQQIAQQEQMIQACGGRLHGYGGHLFGEGGIFQTPFFSPIRENHYSDGANLKHGDGFLTPEEEQIMSRAFMRYFFDDLKKEYNIQATTSDTKDATGKKTDTSTIIPIEAPENSYRRRNEDILRKFAVRAKLSGQKIDDNFFEKTFGKEGKYHKDSSQYVENFLNSLNVNNKAKRYIGPDGKIWSNPDSIYLDDPQFWEKVEGDNVDEYTFRTNPAKAKERLFGENAISDDDPLYSTMMKEYMNGTDERDIRKWMYNQEMKGLKKKDRISFDEWSRNNDSPITRHNVRDYFERDANDDFTPLSTSPIPPEVIGSLWSTASNAFSTPDYEGARDLAGIASAIPSRSVRANMLPYQRHMRLVDPLKEYSTLRADYTGQQDALRNSGNVNTLSSQIAAYNNFLNASGASRLNGILANNQIIGENNKNDLLVASANAENALKAETASQELGADADKMRMQLLAQGAAAAQEARDRYSTAMSQDITGLWANLGAWDRERRTLNALNSNKAFDFAVLPNGVSVYKRNNV